MNSPNDDVFDVFLSHASEDVGFCEKLVNDLQKRRVRVWFDRQQLGAPGNIPERIDQGLAHSRRIIPVLSKHYVSKPWPRAEFYPYVDQDPLGRKGLIVPVLIEECDIPPLLKPLKSFDFSSAALYEVRVKELVHALGLDLPKRADTLHPYSFAPRLLPKRPKELFGREHELQRIEKAICVDHASVGIFGMDGIGKTKLATEIAHRAAPFRKDGCIWIAAAGLPAEAIFSRIVAALNPGRDFDLHESNHPDLARILFGRDVLICLDDLDVESVLVRLCSEIDTPSTLLVTGIRHMGMSALQSIDLGPLTEGAARSMFFNIAGTPPAAPVSLVDDVCSLLGRLPAAIEFVASRTRQAGVVVLEQMLRSPQAGLSLPERICRSYDEIYAGLFPQAKILFATLCMFPSESVGWDAIRKTSRGREADTLQHFETLINLSLVRKTDDERYAVSIIFKSFAAGKLSLLGLKKLPIRNRICRFYFNFLLENRHPLTCLDADAGNIIGCFDWVAGKATAAGRPLVPCLARLLRRTDETGCWVLYLVARLFRRNGALGNAERYYNQCLTFSRRAGFVAIEGASLRSLAELSAMREQDSAKSLGLYEEACRILRDATDVASRKELVFTIIRLVDFYRGKDDQRAEALALESLRVRDILPPGTWTPKEGLATAVPKLLQIYRDSSRFEAAVALVKREETNLDWEDRAVSLGYVGHMLAAAGSQWQPQAEAFLNKALVAYERIRNHGGAAWIMAGLGNLYRAQRKFPQAIESYERAYEYRKSMGEYLPLLVDLLNLIVGHSEFGCGERVDSLWSEYRTDHRAELNNMPRSGKMEIAALMCRSGRAVLAAGKADAALRLLQEGLAIAVSSSDLSGQAAAHEALGVYWQSQGDNGEVRECLRNAGECRRRAGESVITTAGVVR